MALPGNRATKNFFERYGLTARALLVHRRLRPERRPGGPAVSERPELCVGAVAVHDGDLLMIRRGHGPAAGEWSVPGGRVERGELLAEAVVREVREETGLECVCGPLHRLGRAHRRRRPTTS